MLTDANIRTSHIGWLLLLLILVGAAYQSCVSSVDMGGDARREALNRGLVGEPETLDPHNFTSNQAGYVLRDIGEGLVSNLPNGELTGGVAESWSISPDGLTYTFNLRPDAKWSNGQSIVADEFVGAFRALVDPMNASTNANSLQQVLHAADIIRGKAMVEELGVKALSEHHLQIVLHAPTPYFLQLLTHPSTFPVFGVQSRSENRSIDSNVSNGAYVLSSWEIGSELVLRKNNNYWNVQNVCFERVIYHVVKEDSEYNRFRAGELDVTGTVSSGNYVSAKKNFRKELKIAPYLGVYYYGFNMTNPLFENDRNVRKALSLAIDRELLVEKITGRGERPAYGWVPPGTSTYRSFEPEYSILDKTQREEEARRLYRLSGFGPSNPLKFELRYNVSDVQQRIALAIQSMWLDVLGAEAKLVSEEFKVLLSNIRQRQVTDVFRLSWTGEFNDAVTFLQLFESDDPSNMTGYSNSEYDELMLQARGERDELKRQSILEAAEKLAINDRPAIPLYFYVSKHLVSEKVDGWSSNVLNVHRSQHLCPSDP